MEAATPFLEDLLDSGEFPARARSLAGDFRARFGLPRLHQLGLVVPDVVKAAADLERRGIGPFFLAEGSPVRWDERGEERRFSGAMGMAFFEGHELELLAPGEGSDFYRRSLDPGGRTVVQHLGFLVPDVDGHAARLAGEGHPVLVRGRLKAGPLVTEFAYMDTEAAAGLVIEFISWRFLGVRFSPFPGLFRGMGRLEKWSGKRMIRT